MEKIVNILKKIEEPYRLVGNDEIILDDVGGQIYRYGDGFGFCFCNNELFINENSPILKTFVEKYVGGNEIFEDYLRTVLRTKQKELCDKINSTEREFYNKSKFITCKECGSKLATSRLHFHRCPVCNHDLRPTTTLNNIEKLKAELENVRKKISELENKLSKKAHIKWFAKK